MSFVWILDSIAQFIDWLPTFLHDTGHILVEVFADHASLDMNLLPAPWRAPPASDGVRLNDSYIREVSWWPRGPTLRRHARPV